MWLALRQSWADGSPRPNGLTTPARTTAKSLDLAPGADLLNISASSPIATAAIATVCQLPTSARAAPVGASSKRSGVRVIGSYSSTTPPLRRRLTLGPVRQRTAPVAGSSTSSASASGGASSDQSNKQSGKSNQANQQQGSSNQAQNTQQRGEQNQNVQQSGTSKSSQEQSSSAGGSAEPKKDDKKY